MEDEKLASADESDQIAEQPKDKEDEAITAYDISDFTGIFSMFRDGLSEDQIKSHVSNYVTQLSIALKVDAYRIIFLFDDHLSINSGHSDSVYQAIADLGKQADILLVLHSTGGAIEPAYLISRTCKRLCKERFAVSIPRRAKSAATLICLGANELHMGMLSELGPIDPQFGGFPASGLSNALERIADMSCRFPGSAELFAKFLTSNVDIRHLGYFERVNESAVQYAERLLNGKKLPEAWDAKALAQHFTNHYKDHSFVIDSDEATSLLGTDTIKENTPEYEFGNKVYDLMKWLSLCFGIFKKKNISYVGNILHGLRINERPAE